MVIDYSHPRPPFIPPLPLTSTSIPSSNVLQVPPVDRSHNQAPTPLTISQVPVLMPTSKALNAGCFFCPRKWWSENGRCPSYSIESLPDYVILDIFNFFVDETPDIEGWHTLVHVCRRWRCLVFMSPRRLDLRLLCTPKKPVREMLDIWPVLPMIISGGDDPKRLMGGADNIFAALERVARVCHIDLCDIPSLLLEKFTAAMQGPFPILTVLRLSSSDECMPILPDSFLGGSAPRLQSLYMSGVPFPAITMLFLSTLDLVKLDISDIPDSGYISPEAMAMCLSALNRIQELHLTFRSPQSRPNLDNRPPPPLTRFVLPFLTSLIFQGIGDYLDAFLSWIDAPRLDVITMSFFNQLVFDIVHLPGFIGRTERLDTFNQAEVIFRKYSVEIVLSLRTETIEPRRLALEVACEESDWQVSSLAQLCNMSLPPLSTLEWLYIRESRDQRPHWQDDMDNDQWLEFFHPFNMVKNMYLSEEVARRVAPALQVLSEEMTPDVLPALEDLFLEGRLPPEKVQEAIGQFVATRQLSGYPVTVHLGQEGLGLYSHTVAVHAEEEELW